MCEECGNDLAVEGYRVCLDCLESLGADGDLMRTEAALEDR